MSKIFGVASNLGLDCQRSKISRESLSGFSIIADARLDKRQDLITSLGFNTTSHGPFSNTELILAAFRKWGRECVNYLLGDFAFAIWDRKNRQLFCARDPIGARPFYYFNCRETFVFASSAQAVASAEGVPGELNPSRIADLLIADLERINETCSFFRHVSRLPPGHTLLWSPSGISIRRYWQLDLEYELKLRSNDDYVDAFTEVLSEAIMDRITGDPSPASMLSGGLDSSTIVGIAAGELVKNGSGKLTTFSGISEEYMAGDPCVETQHIEKVIASVDVNTVRICPADVACFESGLTDAQKFVEDPFDAEWVLLQMIYSEAAKRGHRFVLDGVDGNMVAGLSSNYPAYLLRGGRISTALSEFRGQCEHYFRRQFSIASTLTAFRGAVVPNPVARLRARKRLPGQVAVKLDESFLSPGLAADVDLVNRFSEYSQARGVGFEPSLRHLHQRAVVTPVLTAAVERYARIAARFGVENRQPLLDRRVIEFCVSLPWNLKARDGWAKFGLRKVAERVLPPSVAWRPGWEQISWKFSVALAELRRQQDWELVMDYGQNLREFINWRKVQEYYLNIRRMPFVYVEAERQLINFVRWHYQLTGAQFESPRRPPPDSLQGSVVSVSPRV